MSDDSIRVKMFEDKAEALKQLSEIEEEVKGFLNSGDECTRILAERTLEYVAAGRGLLDEKEEAERVVTELLFQIWEQQFEELESPVAEAALDAPQAELPVPPQADAPHVHEETLDQTQSQLNKEDDSDE